jgi:hypothetical protein
LKANQLSLFFINFRADMVDFVDFRKVIIKKSAFLTLTNARNGDEKKKFMEKKRKEIKS